MEKSTIEKVGGSVVPQIHLAQWIRPRIFKGPEGIGMWKCCWGNFNCRTLEVGHLLSRGINARSSLTTDSWVLKGFQCLSSDYVLVL